MPSDVEMLPAESKARPLAVVILAAGLGKRMRSAAPKVLHQLGGRPLIAHVLDAARALGPQRVIVVVGHQAVAVEQACRDGGVRFVLQAAQRGTGDAVRSAAPALADFAGDVLILYGDVPRLSAATLGALVDGHRRAGASLSLLTARFPDPGGYGRIVRAADGTIERIVEERDASPSEREIAEVNPGIYCAAADFLLPALDTLRADNAQGEYYLTDIVGVARAQGRRLLSRLVNDPDEVRGINSRAELAEMERGLRDAVVAKWMAAGVTFEDPATAYVAPTVEIGRDTTIGPNTHLRGTTVLGEGCRIDGNAYLQDARLGNRVHLKFGVVITDSDVGDDVEIGPFAHLRPGTRLAEGVHIGNFVETKKAAIGRRTKANHLTYLGDVEVGEETNVGAGTITCNYDGFRKHKTVIGDRVQIGSDTQLVAPVEVGSDAYVGAGTTVVRPVPPGALAVSRAPQRHVAGWVERRRAREARRTGEAERGIAKGEAGLGASAEGGSGRAEAPARRGATSAGGARAAVRSRARRRARRRSLQPVRRRRVRASGRRAVKRARRRKS